MSSIVENVPIEGKSDTHSSSKDTVSVASASGSTTKDQQVEELAKELGIDHKKLMWKIDVCVVPGFCLLYFLSFLDRVNISNARLYGLEADLNMTGDQFNVALALFFVPYILFEIVSNYFIKFIKPHIWLSSCIFLFGGVTIGMAFVKNFGQLVVCRVFIGVTEASTFPALFYILSSFYAGFEAQKRYSVFFSSTCLAGGASGAIAYKINELDGRHGLASWRWVFLVEGVVTAGLAIFLFFIIADFPETARFLKANEKQFIKRKLEIYTGAESGFEVKNTVKDLVKPLKDHLVWLSALAYFGFIIPSYGYAYFSATIIKEMGYTAVAANQHSVYPWIMAFGVSCCLAVFSDYVKHRLGFVIGCLLMAIVGLSMVLGATEDPRVRYGGCFLAATGLYSGMPILVCWNSVNFGGHLRKSVGTATQIGFGNIGGIIAVFLFLAKDAPVYKTGLSVCIASTAFAILMAITYFLCVRRLNNIKTTDAYIEKFDALDQKDRVQAGDLNPGFKYLY